MSDREDSASRSRSRSASSHKSVSPKRSSSRPRSISKKHSRSVSKSPVRRSRSRSYHRESRSRSRDRKYSRSRSHSRRRRSRSRSRSYDRRRSTKYSDKYERSSRSSYQHDRERSPERRRHQGDRNGTCSPMSDRRRHQGDKDNPRKSRCLGVFGLNLRTQERDLREIFERYGQIEDLQIVYDHQTGRSRGFGFVYFKYIEDAIDAKEQATGLNLDGRNIRIDYSITERAHTPTPGVYLGRTAGASMRYGRRSPSPYRGGAARYSRSRSRSRSTSRRRY